MQLRNLYAGPTQQGFAGEASYFFTNNILWTLFFVNTKFFVC